MLKAAVCQNYTETQEVSSIIVPNSLKVQQNKNGKMAHLT